ncbi:RHD3/Sey1 [Amanita rubescens]|nr:RHD3/Sey1 [Amanita rubescens]
MPTADKESRCIKLIDQQGELQQNPDAQIKRWSLSDGHKVVTTFGLASSGKNAFLNLVFGTDFQVTDDEAVQQGVWLCGAKNANAIIVNVEDRCSEMTNSVVHKCALLSVIFSDVLTFHITNISYWLVMRFIKAIFEVSIGLFSKRMYVISPFVDQTLLLFVVAPTDSSVPMSWVQPMLIAELERIWAQQSKPPELADRRLYDYFDLSFMTASSQLCQPEWVKTDVSKPKARFLDKDRVDYAFQPRYQKKIAIDKLGLCMEHLWLQLDNEHADLSPVRGLIESFRRGEVPPIVRDKKPAASQID